MRRDLRHREAPILAPALRAALRPEQPRPALVGLRPPRARYLAGCAASVPAVKSGSCGSSLAPHPPDSFASSRADLDSRADARPRDVRHDLRAAPSAGSAFLPADCTAGCW